MFVPGADKYASFPFSGFPSGSTTVPLMIWPRSSGMNEMVGVFPAVTSDQAKRRQPWVSIIFSRTALFSGVELVRKSDGNLGTSWRSDSSQIEFMISLLL